MSWALSGGAMGPRLARTLMSRSDSNCRSAARKQVRDNLIARASHSQACAPEGSER
jgi:hypothetical protein